MKIGFRTPNFKKKLKAKTTGALKRKAKKAVNPLYGKKGIGVINSPKKALYNKIYNKVTIDPLKVGKNQGTSKDEVDPEYTFDRETVIKYIYKEGFDKLISQKLPEHSKEFILSNVVLGIEDGSFEDEDDIKDYIKTACRNMKINKYLIKFVGFSFAFLFIVILLILI